MGRANEKKINFPVSTDDGGINIVILRLVGETTQIIMEHTYHSLSLWELGLLVWKKGDIYVI